MNTTVRDLIIGALLGAGVCVLVALTNCATTKAVITKGTPVATAAIDCALPSLWNVVTPDAVERDVASAVQQHDPIAALEQLGESAGEAEVTCVAAKMNSTIKAALLSIDGGVQPSVTQQWLDHEAAKGLHVKNFATLGE